MGRRSTCEPGRKAFTPPRMVTEEPALHALADGPFDELVALARGRDLVPDLHLVCFLLGKHDQAVVVLAALDEDVDHVARLHGRDAGRIGELVQRDDAFALAADVDDHVVALDGDDGALDDLPFFAEVASALMLLGLEHRYAKPSAAAPECCSGVLPAELRVWGVEDMWGGAILDLCVREGALGGWTRRPRRAHRCLPPQSGTAGIAWEHGSVKGETGPLVPAFRGIGPESIAWQLAKPRPGAA